MGYGVIFDSSGNVLTNLTAHNRGAYMLLDGNVYHRVPTDRPWKANKSRGFGR